MSNRKPGKPVTHPKILNPENGKIFETYTAAAIDCGGNRYGVMRTCEGLQRHHKKIKFRFVEE